MARTMQTTRKFTAVPLTKRQRQEIAVWKAERDKLITTYPKTPPHPIIKKKPISKPSLKQAKLAKITKLRARSPIKPTARYNLRKKEEGEQSSIYQEQKAEKSKKIEKRLTRKRSKELKKEIKMAKTSQTNQKNTESPKKENTNQAQNQLSESQAIRATIMRINNLCDLQHLYSKLMLSERNRKAMLRGLEKAESKIEKAISEQKNPYKSSAEQLPPSNKRRYKKRRPQIKKKEIETLYYCQPGEELEKKEKEQVQFEIQVFQEKEEHSQEHNKPQVEEIKPKKLQPIVVIDKSEKVKVISLDQPELNQPLKKNIKSNVKLPVLLYLITFTKDKKFWSFNIINQKKKPFFVTIAQQCSCSCNKSNWTCPHLQFVFVNIARCTEGYNELEKCPLFIKQKTYDYVSTAFQIALYPRIDPQIKPKPRKNINQLCPICFNKFLKKEKTTKCDCLTLFHASCLSIWQSRQKEYCPTCKFKQPYRTPSPDKSQNELLESFDADSL